MESAFIMITYYPVPLTGGTSNYEITKMPMCL